jgi:hypothetical protein
LLSKWWYSAPLLTPAAWRTAGIAVASYPFAANSSVATLINAALVA